MELTILLEASIDTQFQTWITITFAFVVAIYASRGRLANSIRTGVTILYLLIAVALLARWMSDGSRLLAMIAILTERGIDFASPYFVAPFTRMMAYILGSGMTVYLSYYFSKERGDGI
jgi:hypothetical protein